MTLRFAAMKELAQYVAAKRKAVEVSGPEGSPVPLAAPILTPEVFEEIARRIRAENEPRTARGEYWQGIHIIMAERRT
jgi:hypothetical protein